MINDIEVKKVKINGKTQFQVSPLQIPLDRAIYEIKKKFQPKADLYYLNISPDYKHYSIGFKSSCK